MYCSTSVIKILNLCNYKILVESTLKKRKINIVSILFTLQEGGSTGSRTPLGRFRVAGVAVLAANRLAHWSRQSKLVLNSHNTQSGISNLLVNAEVEPSQHVTFKGKRHPMQFPEPYNFGSATRSLQYKSHHI